MQDPQVNQNPGRPVEAILGHDSIGRQSLPPQAVLLGLLNTAIAVPQTEIAKHLERTVSVAGSQVNSNDVVVALQNFIRYQYISDDTRPWRAVWEAAKEIDITKDSALAQAVADVIDHFKPH